MTVIRKLSLYPVKTNGQRRSKLLRSDDGLVQARADILLVTDEDGNEQRLHQHRLWLGENEGRDNEGWSCTIKDNRHNIVADTGPHFYEKDCWKAAESILVNKGYTVER